jgi:hypothetical protein
MPDEVIQPLEPRADFFRAERDLAREQISAAWQIQVERIQDDLERGWRDHVARAFDERFDALSAAAEEEIERRVAARLTAETERARASAARELSERLNQTARLLDQAAELSDWSAALLDGAAAFARKVWLFSILSGKLSLEGARSGAAAESAPEVLPEISLDLAAAPAFQSAAESMDAVFSMAAAGELSDSVMALLPPAEPECAERRVCLIPIVVGQSEKQRRAAAIILADGAAGPLDAPVDVNALEIVALFAGLSLDARQAAQRAATPVSVPASGLMQLAGAALPAPPKPAGAAPDWQSLTQEEQELHARAQRFARVRVAEMRLYQAEAVRNGREQARLYMALRGEMDRSRAQFKHEYMHSPSMVDYFHLEVLRTLANDDATLLGPEYPGPLA